MRWVFLWIVFIISPMFAQEYSLMRDPFRQGWQSVSYYDELDLESPLNNSVKLTGVILDGESSQAILNYRGMRQIVRLGQFVDGMRVEDILKSSVRLNRDGKDLILNVGEEVQL